jgi:guanylate kinase
VSGRLFIIAGPAGAGKNRLMSHVMAHDIARQLPTATTRAMRPGEQEGREHLFVTHAEFERMIAANEMLEWQPVHDKLYGIHRPTLDRLLAEGGALIADIDIKGAQAARAALGDQVVIIFVQAPAIASLIDRMRMRGESTAAIGLRLLRVREELAFAQHADAVITNDDVGHAAEKLLAIVRTVLADGRASAFCDPLVHYDYALHAQAIITEGGRMLARRRAPDYPIAACEDDEQPAAAAHRAAVRDLRMLTHLIPPQPISEYCPPAVIDHRLDAAGKEIVTYSYFMPLAQPCDAPDGWYWIGECP